MSHSKLVKMKVCNFGCIGPEGVEVELDNILCIVGANNSGKSTVLKAYEYAVQRTALKQDEISNFMPDGSFPTVELWVHIPVDMENIAENWKEHVGDLRLVRSKWEWQLPNSRPTRSTWNPTTSEYSPDGNASGLDSVFNSRLPQPLSIGTLSEPTSEHTKLLEFIIKPLLEKIEKLTKEEGSELRKLIESIKAEALKPMEEVQETISSIKTDVNQAYNEVFPGITVELKVGMGDVELNLKNSLIKSSSFKVKQDEKEVIWTQEGTGSQRALFWSMVQTRSRL